MNCIVFSTKREWVRNRVIAVLGLMAYCVIFTTLKGRDRPPLRWIKNHRKCQYEVSFNGTQLQWWLKNVLWCSKRFSNLECEWLKKPLGLCVVMVCKVIKSKTDPWHMNLYLLWTLEMFMVSDWKHECDFCKFEGLCCIMAMWSWMQKKNLFQITSPTFTNQDDPRGLSLSLNSLSRYTRFPWRNYHEWKQGTSPCYGTTTIYGISTRM